MDRMLAYGPMKRLLCTLALALPLACAAQAPAAKPAGDGWLAFSFTLEPKKVHEECQRIEAGQKRRYMWRADGPVDFNIHFHRGDDVTYPVKRDAMRGDGGTFSAKQGEDYCWMWTARDKAVKVEGRLETR
jgi:hypothetical protein